MNLLAMMENAPDAVIVLDRQDQVVYWNAGAEKTFGFKAQDMLGQHLDPIIPEKLRQRHTEAFLKFVETGLSRYEEGHTMAVPATHQDGRRLSIAFRLSVEKDARGQIQYVMAVVRDVTAQWQKEQEMSKQLKVCREEHAKP